MNKLLSLKTLLMLLTVLASVAVIGSFSNPSATYAAPGTCTWTGATDGDWSTAGNWSGCDAAGIPETGDSLVFPAGASNLENTNDIVGQTYVDIEVNGDGYTFSALSEDIAFTDSFVINASNIDVEATLVADNTSASTSFSNTGTGNTIGSITMDAAGQTFNMTINDSLNTFAPSVFSGTATSLNITGDSQLSTSTTDATFTAAVFLNGSVTLACRDTACLGNSANTVELFGSSTLLFAQDLISFVHAVDLNGDASIEVGNGYSTTFSGDVDIIGEGTSTVIGVDSVITFSGGINLAEDHLIVGQTSDQSNVNIVSEPLTGAGGLTFADVTGSLSIESPAYDGVITLNDAVVGVNDADDLGSTVANTVITGGGELRLTHPSARVYAESFVINGEGGITNVNDFTATLNGDIVVTDLILGLENEAASAAMNINGVISGAGDVTIDTDGLNAPIVFGGDDPNTYTGTTRVVRNSRLVLDKNADGIIAVPGDLEIHSSEGVESGVTISDSSEQIADDAIVTFEGDGVGSVSSLNIAAGFTETLGGLSGDIYSVINLGDGTSLTLNQTTDTTFAGEIEVLTDSAELTKNGNGVWTFTGTADGDIAVVLNAGTMVVNGTMLVDSFTMAGGVLKGSGTLKTLTATAGTLAAGTSPGVLTVEDGFTLASGVVFEVEIAGTTVGTQYDQLVSEGSVNINGATLTPVMLNSFVPTAGDTFTIMRATTITGTFAGLANGAEVTVGTSVFRINYNLSDSAEDTVVLTYLRSTGLAETGLNVLLPLGALITVGGAAGLKVYKRKTKTA